MKIITSKYFSLITICLFGISLAFLLNGCTKESALSKTKLADSSTVSFCDTITLSQDIQPILTANCAISGCHQAGYAYGDFANYTGISAKVSKFEQRVLTEKNMPPSAPLTTLEQQKLKCWLDAGHPNN